MTSEPVPTNAPTLADPADLAEALAYALRYQGRKRVDTAGDVMARITAQCLVEHLRKSGYVVLKRPPAPLHTPGYPLPATRP